jgi:hypothetical protein
MLERIDAVVLAGSSLAAVATSSMGVGRDVSMQYGGTASREWKHSCSTAVAIPTVTPLALVAGKNVLT